MIVTSRIQSFSRCSVAHLPCTPTFATRPPGRISSVQSSNVSGTPTASIATSAPRPPVSSITRATASSLPLLIVDVGAELERLLEARVGEVDRDDPARRVAASRS